MEGIHKTYNFLYQKNRCQLAFIEQNCHYCGKNWLITILLLVTPVTLHWCSDNTSDQAVQVCCQWSKGSSKYNLINWIMNTIFCQKGYFDMGFHSTYLH